VLNLTLIGSDFGMPEKKKRLFATDSSADSISLSPKIATELLQGISLKHRAALRDLYVFKHSEQEICLRYDLSLVGFRDLRRQLLSRFAAAREMMIRKPPGSGSDVQPVFRRLCA
jgi:hypothetical protein